jgi:hypothetical protein
MSPKGKKILMISVSLLTIGGVVAYVLLQRAKSKKAEKEKADAEIKGTTQPEANQGGGTIGGTIGGTTGGTTGGSSGGSTGGGTTTLSNFDVLQKNLNKKGKNGAVSVMIDSGKYKASFYDNNRFAITGRGGYLKKGNYSNGGFTLVVDGGKTINGTSVYTNLINASK